MRRMKMRRAVVRLLKVLPFASSIGIDQLGSKDEKDKVRRAVVRLLKVLPFA